MSFTLGTDVEHLVLRGSSAIDGTGNTLDNNLTGNGNANSLSGDAGADTLSGGGGADTLNGGNGDDTLTGGSDADTFVVSTAFDNDTITDFVTDTDKIDLTAVTPGTFADLLAAATDIGGNAVITLAGGTITLNGVLKADLSGNDFIGLTGTSGTSGDDTLTGDGNANTIDGGNGKDTISGLGGDDTLIGGNGQDVLAGGAGADTLTGGNGNDDFYFGAASEGIDSITDFTTGSDEFHFCSLPLAVCRPASWMRRISPPSGRRMTGRTVPARRRPAARQVSSSVPPTIRSPTMPTGMAAPPGSP